MNVPKLRFKDDNGNNFPEWESKTLGEIGNVIGGGTPDTKNKIYWNGNINWFTPTEIKSKYVEESKRKITEEGLKKSSAKILPKGTIIVTSRATIGEMSITKEECTTNQGFQSVIVFKNYYNEFVYYSLLSKKREIIEKGNGTTFLEVSNKTFKKLNIPFPCLEEQQKIGNFFATIDKKISQLQEKKRLLALYKKGIMQKIFSQELRFKDENGNYFAEWEEKTLENEILSLTSGKTKPLKEGKFPVYGSMSILGMSDNYTYQGEYILIARVGSAGNLNLVNDTFCVTDNTLILSTKYDNTKFIYYLLTNFNLKKLAFGSVQPLVTATQIKNLLFYFPSLPEQTLIGNFLSAIDKKIAHNDKELALMKEYKKGLLQEMFI
jgi:type I restriction enzyme, S subunit